MCGFSLVAVVEATLVAACGLLLVVVFPVVEPGVQALELGFSGCGARAQLRLMDSRDPAQ